ncbi:hypothetical protein RhiirA5_354027 [Rhizophagus irregularis]|uniref:Uncharacterized protein n=1 Tax=Rhizophagus irregularis TaxID=588596 RepID=A0A2I1E183_9GLOM|nr:hypothetical protein RhiirA5_354027 [Rhizophagus irregularis]PKK63166.1 hypothetical protein RhiirC2_758619 [Rhizophagus irregularis]PKY15851.1 hypothetical protein RhiirB3_402181 [Rhizophagus irregularis]
MNIEHATLEDLKTNDGAVLNFMNDGGRYSPRNDVAFRDMLQSLVTLSLLCS